MSYLTTGYLIETMFILYLTATCDKTNVSVVWCDSEICLTIPQHVVLYWRHVKLVSIAVHNRNPHTATEITCHMGSHSVTCHLAAVTTFSPLPQPKLVLDLATLEGCKAELTWKIWFDILNFTELLKHI